MNSSYFCLSSFLAISTASKPCCLASCFEQDISLYSTFIDKCIVLTKGGRHHTEAKAAFVSFRCKKTAYVVLLYRQECFTGKYTTRKIHTKLHPGTEWRIFQILTSEDIDDVISHPFTDVRCKQSVQNGEQ